MCDFSLEHLASRPAKVGDQLVTTKFGGMFTTGFCSVGEPSLAVCIKPGTELAFAEVRWMPPDPNDRSRAVDLQPGE